MDLFSNKGQVLNINTTTISSGGADSVYNEEPSGVRNGTNRIFTTVSNFVTKSTRLYLGGQRMKIGASYDYLETSSNQITFNYNIGDGELIIDYTLSS